MASKEPKQKHIQKTLDGNNFTISKKDALKQCESCTSSFKKGCIRGDIESAKHDIDVPDCMRTHFFQRYAHIHPTTNALFFNEKNQQQENENALFLGKCTKNAQKSAFSGRIREQRKVKISKTEQEYLDLISSGVTDKKRIAEIRKCKIRIVQNTFNKLRKKGLINTFNEKVRFDDRTNQKVHIGNGTTKQLPSEGGAKDEKCKRLHGQQLHVYLLDIQDRYLSRIGSVTKIEGNTITANRNVIQIGSNTSFYDDDPYQAWQKSLDYFYRIFSIIENDYGVTIVKDRKANIRFVKAGEYGEIGNELALQCHKEGDKIRVSGDDGKTWFLIDNSFNLLEAETNHPEEAQRDMAEVVAPFFNDLRRHPVTMTELVNLIENQARINKEAAEINKESAAGLNALLLFMKSQIPDQKRDDKDSKDNKNKEGMMYG